MNQKNLNKLLFELCSSDVNDEIQSTILLLIEKGLNFDNIITHLNDKN